MTTKTDTPITLAAWLVERQRVLKAFAADWRSHQTQAPEDWPEEMSAGDWDEQYAAYLEMQMTDDIKLPPLPPPFKKAVYATSANTKSVRDGVEMGGYEKDPPLFDDAQMHEYARAAVEADRQDHLRDATKMVPSDEEIVQLFADVVGNTEDGARFLDLERDHAIRIAHTLLTRYGSGQPARPTDDALWDQTLRERDEYHDMADDLAAQIAAITGHEIGEHSSANDPWRNAMLAADDYIADQLRKLCAGPAASAEPADPTLPYEQTLAELVGKILPGVDTGNLLADARQASAALGAGVSVAQEPVAYRVLRKTLGGEWKSDGRDWCDGRPSADLVADIAKRSDGWRIEYAYATSVAAQAQPVVNQQMTTGSQDREDAQ